MRPTTQKTTGRLAISLGLTAALVAIEAVAGLLGNSLALLADAGHNLTDVIALALSWYALRLQSRVADARNTYGYHRAGILVALVNSTTLVLIAFGILWEAFRRMAAPPEVQADLLVIVGLAAFLINLGSALVIREASRNDLNLRSAFVHLMGDVLSTLGAVGAGVAIALTGMNWLDPLVSVLIAALILWNAWGILKETVSILLESTPEDVDPAGLVTELLRVPGVNGVHDLHVWSIAQGMRALSAHILTGDMALSESSRIQREIKELLHSQYNIAQGTLQLECADCEPAVLYCNIADNHAPAGYQPAAAAAEAAVRQHRL